MSAGLDAAHTGLIQAATVEPTRLAQRELRSALQRLDQIRAATDRVTIAVLAEAIDRGEAGSGGYRLTDWILRLCPTMARSHAADLGRIASALASASGAERIAHEPIGVALDRGEISARRASMVLRALDRLRPVADEPTYAADVSILLDAARRTTFSEGDLARITDRLLTTALPEAELADRERCARQARGVVESSLADGSLIRFIVMAEPEGAATIRSILTSPLASPTPEVDGTPDPRTPAQRRYDALVMMLGRGVASPEGQPTTAKAQVTITMPYDVLAAALSATESVAGRGSTIAGGSVRRPQDGIGPGLAITGQVFSATTVRRIACDADLIPAVLGTSSELLDLGRTHRLVTPGQRRALALRDLHCSSPGCSVPASWCDAHHLVHWARGGRSDLSNYALLCPRHHTQVHTDDVRGVVDATAPPGLAVTWMAQPRAPDDPGDPDGPP